MHMTKGLIFSQAVLLALAKKGITREKAYQLVQENAMEVWESGEDCRAKVLDDDGSGVYLNKAENEYCFEFDDKLKNVDFIFERIGLK